MWGARYMTNHFEAWHRKVHILSGNQPNQTQCLKTSYYLQETVFWELKKTTRELSFLFKPHSPHAQVFCKELTASKCNIFSSSFIWMLATSVILTSIAKIRFSHAAALLWDTKQTGNQKKFSHLTPLCKKVSWQRLVNRTSITLTCMSSTCNHIISFTTGT